METNETVEYVSIAPDIEGMKAWLTLVAKDDHAMALWGVRVAQSLGILDWYADTLAKQRGWEN